MIQLAVTAIGDVSPGQAKHLNREKYLIFQNRPQFMTRRELIENFGILKLIHPTLLPFT